jgi:hypothetical protein
MMRLRNTVGLAVAAGLALRAAADVNTLVRFEVSSDHVNWTDDLTVQAGRRVWVRTLVTYTGAQQPLGLAAMVYQPTVSMWDASGSSVDEATVCTDVILPPPYCTVTDPNDPNQFGRVSPFNRAATSSSSQITGFVHIDGSGGAPPGTWLRIAQRQVTSWIGAQGNTTGGSGINIAQLSNVGRTTSDPSFDHRLTDVLVYKFGIWLSTDTAPRTMIVDAPIAGFGNRNSTTGERQVYWWADMNEASGTIRGGPAVLPARIHVQACGSADFNYDGDAGTDADIETFFACLAGNCCGTCGSADFNGDGDMGTDADIEAFFRVLAGGSC